MTSKIEGAITAQKGSAMTNSLHHPGSHKGVCRAQKAVISEGEGWVVAGMRGSVISEGGGWVVAGMRGYLRCTKHKNQTRIPHADIPWISLSSSSTCTDPN